MTGLQTAAGRTCVFGCTNTLQDSVPQQRVLANSAAARMNWAGSPPHSRPTSCMVRRLSVRQAEHWRHACRPSHS
jgi:hypothetical protein